MSEKEINSEHPEPKEASTEDKRPQWLKDNEVGMGSVVYGESTYPCTVVKKELEPRLPGFVGFPEGKNLFCSEEVPEDYREWILTHEIIEFTELKGQEGRCVSALKQELEKVPDEMKAEYIAYRKAFFERLVAYYESSDDKAFKKEITASLEYLESA